MKIAVITGSRADRGPLEPVYDELARSHDVAWLSVQPNLAPNLAPRGKSQAAHLSGSVCQRVADELNFEGDIDLVVLLGDRFEILGAAVAANVSGIPIAHLSGGDITEGSQDDCYRHAITKLSHLHFATHRESANRIIQMGEETERVYTVGCPGIDAIARVDLMTRSEAMAAAGVLYGWPHEQPTEKLVVACWHPSTLGNVRKEALQLAVALADTESQTAVVIVGPNADAGCEIVRAVMRDVVGDCYERSNVAYHDTLDRRLYLSLLSHADALVGNSSAGLYEAPTFGTPTINVGDRQRGRRQASSVVTVDCDVVAIADTLRRTLEMGRPKLPVTNPYGDGHAAERIAATIDGIKNPKDLLRKRWRYLGRD